jgi:beta-lactam-binding protein with PASTA domain/tRNA A-37 threonylcarbamoyl transferase component Bud32
VSAAVQPTLVGQVLDRRYRVLSHIADGGMASVFVALDERLDREVALKVMRPSLAADETFVSRFRREARSAARLSHPNVVAVYDQGDDEGRMFLAMELVSGHTLREVIQDEGPLTPRAALDIIDPVLQALGAAHSAGLIHRDVKPENVILREDGMVKVADFGLARAVTNATSTAQTGVLLGTVAYLSPEQVERGIADARSDVYAAGLLLFEMLTGTKAFSGDTPIHVAYQHVHSTVPAPSSRVPTVPGGLDRLVALATDRDPDGRPVDANAFLVQVRRTRQALTPAELDLRTEPAAAASVLAATVAMPRNNGADAGDGGDARDGHTTVVPVPAPATPPPGGDSRRWPWAVLALALVAAAAGAWFFLAGPGARTTVPPVVALTLEQAQRRLSHSHLTNEVDRAFDEKVRSGVVMTSDPGAGAELGRGSTVRLTVSRGPERYTVPDLVGSSRAEAGRQLTARRLQVGDVTGRYDESVPAGQVISMDPGAGTSVKRGTRVALVLSKGREPIDVVDWTGRSADAAVTSLTNAGLTVDATRLEFSTTVAKGSVIRQDPPSGTLYRGDKVTLVVSRGPEMVRVPDVERKQEDQARAILERAGFTVEVRRFLGGAFGTVRLQDPSGGSMAPKGSTVVLTVV